MTGKHVVEIREPSKEARQVTVAGIVELGRQCDGEQLQDTQVSRRHLRLTALPDGLVATDLGSTNGTFLNGTQLSSETPIRAGDVLQLGGTQVEVIGQSAPATQRVRAVIGPGATVRVAAVRLDLAVEIREPSKTPWRLPVLDRVELGRDGDGVNLDDPGVSRRHLLLTVGADGLVATDLGSTNGTTLNGVVLVGDVPIRSGDVIRLGGTEVVVLGEPAPATTMSPGVGAAAGPVEPAAAAIDVEGLQRYFGSFKAVDGIDLRVERGEIFGFLGPNGAGKSTTVLMLTTLLPPTGGRAIVGGFDLVREASKVRGTIGAALQEVALDPALTAREHMRLQAALQNLPRRDRIARGEELLERVGLSDAADRRAGTYSGGMRRRLDLALALVHRPTILFLDEPTTGLDPQSRSGLWAEVARLAQEEAVTVFLTTQYLEEADVLADRIAIIDHGHIVATGTPAALKAEIGRPSVEVVPAYAPDYAAVSELMATFGELHQGKPGAVRVRLREGAGALGEVVRALDQRGLAITNVELHAPTLDDVFLAKTGRTLEGAATAHDGDAAPPGPPGRGRPGRGRPGRGRPGRGRPGAGGPP